MLKEIFSTIAAEIESYLLEKGLATKVKTGIPDRKPGPGNLVYITMQEYGIDPFLKNHGPTINEEGPGVPNYSHLISFYILPVSSKYNTRLQLIEAIVELFEVKPFFNLVIGRGEYELSISMKTVTTSTYEQFWIANQQSPQPVVFYQARVSAL